MARIKTSIDYPDRLEKEAIDPGIGFSDVISDKKRLLPRGSSGEESVLVGPASYVRPWVVAGRCTVGCPGGRTRQNGGRFGGAHKCDWQERGSG